jgi:response regulator of citrate/malate metabolism
VTVRVLVVEDEELAAEAHAAYVERVDGFEVAGVARSAGEAARFLARDPEVDLILLDMNLPDGHGLGLLSRLRSAGHVCDVIAVTAARDLDVVQHAVAQGVVLYLLKPFTFATFRAKLAQYAAYRRQLASTSDQVAQGEIDQLLGSLRPAPQEDLPKGMGPETSHAVVEALRGAADGLSATQVAELVGTSRVTARRYLEHLTETGRAERRPRYSGGGGRPEMEYRWS